MPGSRLGGEKTLRGGGAETVRARTRGRGCGSRKQPSLILHGDKLGETPIDGSGKAEMDEKL